MKEEMRQCRSDGGLPPERTRAVGDGRGMGGGWEKTRPPESTAVQRYEEKKKMC